MKKLNQKGSHVLVVLVILIVLTALAGIGYWVFTKQSSKGSSANSNGLSSAFTLECVPRGHDNYRTNSTLAVDPNDPNVMYVGVEYKGFYKSTDGGTTWKESDTGIRGYAKEQNPNERCIQELGVTVIDPLDSKHILLSRVESPGDSKTRFSENAGLWESKDAGASWHQLIQPGMNMSGSRAIAFAPGDSKTIYYGVNNSHPSYTEGGKNASNQYFNTKGIVYKTTDGGAHWAELPTGADKGLRATNIAIDASNPQLLWLLTFTQNQDGGGIDEGAQMGPMKSTDGGTTWTSYASKLPAGARIAVGGQVNPLDSNNVFVTTQNMSGPQIDAVTTDGGASWQAVRNSILVASYDTNDPTGHRLIGYDAFGEGGGGIYESRNKGVSWSRLSALPAGVNNSDNFGVRIEGFAFSKAAPGTIYMSGSEANVWKSTDNGKTWTKIMSMDSIGGPNKNKDGNLKSREQDPR